MNPNEETMNPTVEEPADETVSATADESVADTIGAAAAELAALRTEAETLRSELAAERRISAELREFVQLYPETPQSAIPDSVWSRVKAGIPLAAAYALHERKQLLQRAAAETAQAESKTRSSGALDNTPGEMPYTPAEVRSMSADEVRRNYTAIVASMRRW